jgi:hypothetical protein
MTEGPNPETVEWLARATKGVPVMAVLRAWAQEEGWDLELLVGLVKKRRKELGIPTSSAPKLTTPKLPWQK